MRAPLPFDAIIIAGGRGSRLGGIDKPTLWLRETTLLDLVISAVSEANRVCIVGPERRVTRGDCVIWALEEPRGGGPAAALGAGIRALSTTPAPFTLVLAADLVRPSEAVAVLTAASIPDAAEGLIAVDESGHRQPLLAVYRTAALGGALAGHLGGSLAGSLDGLSVRRLLIGLDLVELPVPDDLCADVDTPDDAHRHGIDLPLGPPTDDVASL